MLQFPCLPVYQKEFCFIYTQKNTKNNTRHPKNHEGYVKPLVVSVKPLVASVKPLVGICTISGDDESIFWTP